MLKKRENNFILFKNKIMRFFLCFKNLLKCKQKKKLFLKNIFECKLRILRCSINCKNRIGN